MTIFERIRAAQLSVHRVHSYTSRAVISPAATLTALSTAQKTTNLNLYVDRKLNQIYDKTCVNNQRIAHILNRRINPGGRVDWLSQSAISKAWQAERLEVELGGNSNNWTKAQRKELLETGRVKGYEGNHQQSVKYHSEEQANPDNIQFYSHEYHLKVIHRGNYKNESNAPMCNRRQRINSARRRSVIKNELLGGTIVAVVTFITSAGLRFVIEMVKSNRSPEDVKNALNLALREGAEAAGYALFSYGFTKLSLYGGKKMIELLNLKLSTNAMKWVEGSIAAVAVAIAVGIITYIKMRQMGYDRKESFLQAGKTAMVSLGIAMISLIATINGSMALAIGLNVAIVVISASFMLFVVVHEKRLMEQIQVYTIQEIAKRCVPIAA